MCFFFIRFFSSSRSLSSPSSSPSPTMLSHSSRSWTRSKNTTVARNSTQLLCQNDVKWDWCNLVRRATPFCHAVSVFVAPSCGSQPPRWYTVYTVVAATVLVVSSVLACTGCFRDKRLDSRLILMTYEVKPNDRGSPSYTAGPSSPLTGLSITFEFHGGQIE